MKNINKLITLTENNDAGAAIKFESGGVGTDVEFC